MPDNEKECCFVDRRQNDQPSVKVDRRLNKEGKNNSWYLGVDYKLKQYEALHGLDIYEEFAEHERLLKRLNAG
ncbi:MAG: hypothetical protein HRU20_06400 [Pseudomonadales bacterium]|nr:hypothetical protein [Pseudomonadales bacterium]